mgnify:CR=1 FL=1
MLSKKIKSTFLFLPLLLVACADKDTAPLKFPTIEPCTKELLNSSESMLCVEDNEGQDLILIDIMFATNSFALRENAKETLDKLYAYLKLTNQQSFTINGYASRTESALLGDNNKVLAEQNTGLSRDRANTVKHYLVDKGLDADKMNVDYHGYQTPITANDSNTNRVANQRVEITIKTDLLDQIDYLKSQFKHVNIDKYKRFFSNVYLLNNDENKYIAQIFDSREKRPVLAENFTILVNKPFDSIEDAQFNITSEPKPISELDEDLEVYKLGTAEYKYTYQNTTSILKITDTSREVQIGNYVIPTAVADAKLPETSFNLPTKVTGNVLKDVENTRTMSSSLNNILINRGSADGLKYGTEMFLYKPETRVDGYPVPPKYLGYGFIYRMSEHYSLILIVNSLEEITPESMATTRM